MMETKICIICGKEHNRRSRDFCSRKCRDKWYNAFYYYQNKEEVLEKNRKWAKDNRQRANEIANQSYHRRKKLNEQSL